MNTKLGLWLAIVLYIVFSAILWMIWHVMIVFFVAGLATAIVGYIISRVVEGMKA